MQRRLDPADADCLALVDPASEATSGSKASLEILNVPPVVGGGAPTNGMFTIFGQFFDHGLDLVGKTGNEIVMVPLRRVIRSTTRTCVRNLDADMPELHDRQSDDRRTRTVR